MNISESIANYFHETSWGKWDLFGCFNCVLEMCKDITSEDCEKIKTELRFHLRSISTHNSMSQKVHNKANKLLDGLDQFFQSKRVTLIFDERDAEVNEKILNTKSKLYGSEVNVHVACDKLASLYSMSSSTEKSSSVFQKIQDEDDELNKKCTSSSPLQDSYMKDPNYFDSLVDNVDLSYIGSEEEPISACIKPTVSVTNSWDSFKIDDVDIVKFFESLRDSLPKKDSEVHPQYWGVLDLTGQHKPTRNKFISIWDELVNNFLLNVAWKMVGLDQSESDFFDNIEDIKAQQRVPILHAHLTILKSYLEHLKLPINEGELMIHIVAPAFRMSMDRNQEKFRKLWGEQQLVASQERRRVNQDPNNDRARIGQKTDLIVTLPTGPALEGFICEVSGGLPAGCPKKIWTDKLKIMVGMRDMINRIIKTFPGLLPEDYMKIMVFGCQVIGLQINLYAMDVRAYGVYRFGLIDKAFLPASTQELSSYESVHTMMRSLECRLSNLTDYCSEIKVKHAKLRRKRDYSYQEDNFAFTNDTPRTSFHKKMRSETDK